MNIDLQAVAMLTTAPMGGFKSYTRGPAFAIDVWLPEYEGILYTTIPLRVDVIAEIAWKKYKIPKEETKRRIHVFSPDLIKSWIREGGNNGPWDIPLEKVAGCHFQFDEFQYFAPRTQEVPRRRLWREWISEVRHEQATVEFLTQDISSIDKDIVSVVPIQYQLVNLGTHRDPLFKIQLNDWYQLRSKFFGYWCPCVAQLEFSRIAGRLKQEEKEWRVRPNSKYYKAYDSYCKPQKRLKTEGIEDKKTTEEMLDEKAEVKETVRKNQMPWEKFGWLRLLSWFYFRNFFSLSTRFAILGVLYWLLCLGGSAMVFQAIMEFPKKIQSQVMAGPLQDKNSLPKKSTRDTKQEKTEVSEVPEVQQLLEIDPVLISTDFEKEGHREYRASDMKQLVVDRELLYLEIDKLTDEVGRLKGEAEKLVMIGNDFVIFSDGRKYKTGDILETKGYYEKKINSIDILEGVVMFDDSSCIVLGRMRSPADERRSNITNVGRFIQGKPIDKK